MPPRWRWLFCPSPTGGGEETAMRARERCVGIAIILVAGCSSAPEPEPSYSPRPAPEEPRVVLESSDVSLLPQVTLTLRVRRPDGLPERNLVSEQILLEWSGGAKAASPKRVARTDSFRDDRKPIARITIVYNAWEEHGSLDPVGRPTGGEAEAAAALLFEKLREPGVEVAVYNVSAEQPCLRTWSQPIAPLPRNPPSERRQSLHAALPEIARQAAGAPARRPSLFIVIAEDADLRDLPSEDEAQAFGALNATVWVFAVRQAVSPSHRTDFLHSLTRGTGGEFVEQPDSRDLRDSLRRLYRDFTQQRLQNQYEIVANLRGPDLLPELEKKLTLKVADLDKRSEWKGGFSIKAPFEDLKRLWLAYIEERLAEGRGLVARKDWKGALGSFAVVYAESGREARIRTEIERTAKAAVEDALARGEFKLADDAVARLRGIVAESKVPSDLDASILSALVLDARSRPTYGDALHALASLRKLRAPDSAEVARAISEVGEASLGRFLADRDFAEAGRCLDALRNAEAGADFVVQWTERVDVASALDGLGAALKSETRDVRANLLDISRQKIHDLKKLYPRREDLDVPLGNAYQALGDLKVSWAADDPPGAIGHLREAIKFYSDLLNLATQDATAAKAIAASTVLLQRRLCAELRYPEAIEDLNRAKSTLPAQRFPDQQRELHRAYVETLYRVGNIKFDEGNLDEALGIFEEIVRDSGQFTGEGQKLFWLRLAEARLKAGDLDRAIRAGDSAHKLDSTNDQVRKLLAQAYREKASLLESSEKWEDAIDVLREGLVHEEDRKTWIRLSDAYEKAGKYTPAAQAYRQAMMKADPASFPDEFYDELFRRQFAAGQFDDATDCARDRLKKKADSNRTFQYALCAMQASAHQTTIELLRTGIERGVPAAALGAATKGYFNAEEIASIMVFDATWACRESWPEDRRGKKWEQIFKAGPSPAPGKAYRTSILARNARTQAPMIQHLVLVSEKTGDFLLVEEHLHVSETAGPFITALRGDSSSDQLWKEARSATSKGALIAATRYFGTLLTQDHEFGKDPSATAEALLAPFRASPNYEWSVVAIGAKTSSHPDGVPAEVVSDERRNSLRAFERRDSVQSTHESVEFIVPVFAPKQGPWKGVVRIAVKLPR